MPAPRSNVTDRYPDPATDFPAEVAVLYPPTFRYPKGYFPSSTRVTEPEVLCGFEPWQRPYVRRDEQGAAFVDQRADGVRKLLRPADGSVLGALRYLQWSGPPDTALEATFACEDRTELAETFSKVGFHGAAIHMVHALPAPFQQTSAARTVLLRSYTALAQYEPALENARALMRADDITGYARDLYHLEEIHLLLLLDRRAEAEPLLDRRRPDFRKFYFYYGLRAALAWMDGEVTLAKGLIIRAGRADPYHSPKLLWSALLRPLYPIIRRELLDADHGPMVYRRDEDVRRLCHRIQGALLTDKHETARNLVEGLTTNHILKGDTAEQFVLCLAGLGEFVRLRGLAGTLPGWNGYSLRLAATVADAFLEPGPAVADKLRDLFSSAQCSPATQAAWEGLLPYFASGELPPRIASTERVLGSISDRWEESGRQHFMLVERAGRFEAQGIWQRSGNPVHLSTGIDLRREAEVNTVSWFEGADEFYGWLEAKLAENMATAHIQFPRPRWEVYLSGFGLLPMAPPSTLDTPLLAEVVTCMANDPPLYFSSGPIPRCYGMGTPFADRLIRMLAVHSATTHRGAAS